MKLLVEFPSLNHGNKHAKRGFELQSLIVDCDMFERPGQEGPNDLAVESLSNYVLYGQDPEIILVLAFVRLVSWIGHKALR